MSGSLAPFGEVVITVVAFTRGKNAREVAYRGAFEVFSDEVCVCRDQSIEMAIELIVTAEASAEIHTLKCLTRPVSWHPPTCTSKSCRWTARACSFRIAVSFLLLL